MSAVGHSWNRYFKNDTPDITPPPMFYIFLGGGGYCPGATFFLSFFCPKMSQNFPIFERDLQVSCCSPYQLFSSELCWVADHVFLDLDSYQSNINVLPGCWFFSREIVFFLRYSVFFLTFTMSQHSFFEIVLVFRYVTLILSHLVTPPQISRQNYPPPLKCVNNFPCHRPNSSSLYLSFPGHFMGIVA